MDKKIGFIGCGNMATAIISGLITSKLANPQNVYVTDISVEATSNINERFGVQVANDCAEIAHKCDVIIPAVKPHQYEAVIESISDLVKPDVIVISIAPGKTIWTIDSYFGKETKIVRTMPNTPAMVGEGMTAYCVSENITADEEKFVAELLSSFGRCEKVSEYQMDAVVGVSGSSPAYVYMFIEALADSAVASGLSRSQAYTFAAQAVLGSAKMVLETGLHPGVLKDMVCSPGGTTIDAVSTLEAEGFRSAVFKAAKTASEKSAKM